ncbi:hypothetical protein C4D60_Mb04t34830 [Musa balbisiana]|uniref:Uncharacterized protein n=1 Tax=Musa balbisiana TaxID=52838 RepID=A0A4V4HA91_MUSBA|nr:hypothetical protein C4D60_Mb04t34830 [Musa balbisiana]
MDAYMALLGLRRDAVLGDLVLVLIAVLLENPELALLCGKYGGGMIGGTTIQTLILLWVAFQTDWNKEVEEAKRRLSKWEEEKEPLLS